MSDVSQWNVSASSNNSAPPDGWPEGQAPSSVNNCGREVMAAVARWYAQMNGSLTSGGTANAQTITTSDSHAALGDIPMLVFEAGATNTAACTLAVDGLTAKNIQLHGTNLAGGEIVSGQTYAVVYNSTNDKFDLISRSPEIRYLAIRLIAKGDDLPTASTSVNVGGRFYVPFSGTILQSDTLKNQLSAAVDTAGTTNETIVDIHLNGTTIMTTNKLDIETTEVSTTTATTQPDLTTTSITAGDYLEFFVDQNSTTKAKGLTVYMAIRES